MHTIKWYIIIGVLISMITLASAFKVQITDKPHIIYSIDDKDTYVGLRDSGVTIPNIYNLKAPITICPYQKSNPTASLDNYAQTPIKLDGVQIASFDIRNNLNTCFNVTPDFTKKTSYEVKLGFASISLIFNTTNSTALYSTAVTSNNLIIYGGVGKLLAYNFSGSNIWNLTYSTNANGQAYTLIDFKNDSGYEKIAFIPKLNATSQTMLYVINTSGSMLCNSSNLITASVGLGGGVDVDSWDINNNGNRSGLAVLYDDGNKNAKMAGFYDNCSQKLTSQTISTATGVGNTEGVVFTLGAKIRALNNGSGFYNRVVTGSASGSNGPPILQIQAFDYTIVKNWTQATLTNAGPMVSGDFRSEVGDEVVGCGRSSLSCNIYLWNGTIAILGLPFATEQWMIPHLKVGTNAYESFLRHSSASVLNMTNGTGIENWDIPGVSMTSDNMGDYDGDGLQDTCFDNSGSLVLCYNNSGGQIGNSTLQSTSGYRWGKGGIATIKNSSCGYKGDCLAVSDNKGYGYMFNFTAKASTNTCTAPSSGNNWNLLCSDNCTISSAVNLGSGNLTISGSGFVYLSSSILVNNYFWIKPASSYCKINNMEKLWLS